MIEWLLTTPQHKSISAIGCSLNNTLNYYTQVLLWWSGRIVYVPIINDLWTFGNDLQQIQTMSWFGIYLWFITTYN